jgi:hypothetical protein
MERTPHEDKYLELEKYAGELFDAVDFMFVRRGVLSKTGDTPANRYGELILSHKDLKDLDGVSEAFTDNFIDPPTSVEISLLGLNPNQHPEATTGGLMIITTTDDVESECITIYTIWFTATGAENIQVTKDTSRRPKLQDSQPIGLLINPDYMSEKIFTDAPIDQSERAALRAMIEKL